MKYELHKDLDADFPLIFGFRELSASHPEEAYLHWHDCIELIYCESGHGQVLSGVNRISIQKGDIAIVNSGSIHDVFTESQCGVYSLDLGSALYAPFGLEPHLYTFQEKIKDAQIEAAIKRIMAEMNGQDKYYRQAVQAEIILIVLALMREHLAHGARRRSGDSSQVQAVKKTISYLREHFLGSVTMEELCANTGYSKYYLCHSFKKATGVTIIQYVNFLKCRYARNLLQSGSCNVNESAALSGFGNDSYFTRTYKTVFGRLPSEELGKKCRSRMDDFGEM